MKALIAIMVVVILGLVGITAAVIHFSSFDTIEANIITGTSISEPTVEKKQEVIPKAPIDNGNTGTSAKDKLQELQNQEIIENKTDADKTGYTLGYIMAQQDTSACDVLIKDKEDDIEDAKRKLKNAQEDLDKANNDLEDIRDENPIDRDKEEQSLEDRKVAQDAVEDALDEISGAKEDLMKQRLACAGYN